MEFLFLHSCWQSGEMMAGTHVFWHPSSKVRLECWRELRNNCPNCIFPGSNLLPEHLVLPEPSILEKQNIQESQSDATVVQKGKKVACRLQNYHFWHPYRGILVSKCYSIFQMAVSGISPYPNPGSGKKRFHMRVIPYEIIPHEEFNCIVICLLPVCTLF